MNFKLRILEQAALELNEIHNWIKDRSESAAENWLEALRNDADVSSIFEHIYSNSARGAEIWLNTYQQARLRLATNADGCPLADEYE